MFCEKCGKQLDEGTVFCTGCGNRLQGQVVAPVSDLPVMKATEPSANSGTHTFSQPTASPAAMENKSPKKSKTGLVVGVGILLLIIIAVILLSGGGKVNKDYKVLVETYFDAVNKEDFNMLLKCYDKDAIKDLKDDKKDVIEELQDLNDDMKDTYSKSWRKDVEVGKRSKIDSDDDVVFYSVIVDIDDMTNAVYIKKVGEKYYIDEERDQF